MAIGIPSIPITREPDPHIQRMLFDRYDLYKKELALTAYIEESADYEKLDDYQKGLAVQQRDTMKIYRDILEKRIKAAERSHK